MAGNGFGLGLGFHSSYPRRQGRNRGQTRLGLSSHARVLVPSRGCERSSSRPLAAPTGPGSFEALGIWPSGREVDRRTSTRVSHELTTACQRVSVPSHSAARPHMPADCNVGRLESQHGSVGKCCPEGPGSRNRNLQSGSRSLPAHPAVLTATLVQFDDRS